MAPSLLETRGPFHQRRLLLCKSDKMAALGGGNAAATRSNQASRSRFDPGKTPKPLELGGSGEYGVGLRDRSRLGSCMHVLSESRFSSPGEVVISR